MLAGDQEISKHGISQYQIEQNIPSTGAAMSVMNNISEGWASQSNAEFIRFLTYSRRSCAEVQNCFYVAADQEYIKEITLQEIYNQAKKVMMIIDGLLRYLRSRGPKRPKRS
jgi:four helix bundle protein